MEVVTNAVEAGVNPQTMYPYGAVVYNNNFNPPVTQNVLTQEEMNLIKKVPQNKFDLDISEEEYKRLLCNHFKDGKDMVQSTNDGEVWCPICSVKWDPNKATVEEVKRMVDYLLNAFQNAKWVGNLPPQLTRDFFSIAAVLQKFPGIYEYAMNNHERYMGVNAYSAAGDANPYAHYNNIMGYGNAGYYQQPYMGYAQPQQPYMGYAQPQQVMNQPFPQQQPMGMNPAMNPMQMPMNPQFTNQADMYTNGGYYNYAAQPTPVTPQPQQVAPVYQPGAVTQTAEVVNTENGEATSTTTVTL